MESYDGSLQQALGCAHQMHALASNNTTMAKSRQQFCLASLPEHMHAEKEVRHAWQVRAATNMGLLQTVQGVDGKAASNEWSMEVANAQSLICAPHGDLDLSQCLLVVYMCMEELTELQISMAL